MKNSKQKNLKSTIWRSLTNSNFLKDFNNNVFIFIFKGVAQNGPVERSKNKKVLALVISQFFHFS